MDSMLTRATVPGTICPELQRAMLNHQASSKVSRPPTGALQRPLLHNLFEDRQGRAAVQWYHQTLLFAVIGQ